MNLLKKILLFLVLTSLTATGVMYLLEAFENLEDSIIVVNNKIICDNEIKEIITSKYPSGKRFIEYNSLKFAELLKEKALIKEVLVRATIFPSKRFIVIVNEEELWGVYRNKLLNSKFSRLKDYEAEEGVIQISSNQNLENHDLKKIKKLIEDTNKRLKLVNLDQINSVEMLDDDLSLKSPKLKLIFGKVGKKYKKKIRKLDHLLSTLKEKHNEISYIDLSLDTDEAIIGKRI